MKNFNRIILNKSPNDDCVENTSRRMCKKLLGIVNDGITGPLSLFEMRFL